MQNLIAVDPGQSGSIVACWSENGKIVQIAAEPMPATTKDIFMMLSDMVSIGDNHFQMAIMENVWGHFPGNGVASACKFATHIGHLEMALTALEIQWGKVHPSTWMKAILGNVPKDKKERKNAIKAAMQRRWPDQKITLVNADAFGILTAKLDGKI